MHPLFFEGGAALLDAGYVIAASDYQGLGALPAPTRTSSGVVGGHQRTRLGSGGARASGGRGEPNFVVWGHSQGGHASLFTGRLASTYAPELRLLGVAAGAPVPNLVDLFKVNIETQIGKVLIAMALQSWERVYDAADLDQIVTPSARPSIARIARNCLYNQRQILASVPSASCSA